MTKLVEYYGNCCKSLQEVLIDRMNPMFREEDDKIFRIAYDQVPLASGGFAYYEKVVIYCPFCGKQLQDFD